MPNKIRTYTNGYIKYHNKYCTVAKFYKKQNFTKPEIDKDFYNLEYILNYVIYIDENHLFCILVQQDTS